LCKGKKKEEKIVFFWKNAFGLTAFEEKNS